MSGSMYDRSRDAAVCRARARLRRRMGARLAGLALIAAGTVWITPVLAQETNVDGHWAGVVQILGQELPFTVDFAREGGELSATMDIEVQGAFDLPRSEVSAADGRVHFELEAGPGLAVWDGAVEGDTVEGEFTQGGARGTFTMSRGAAAADAAGTTEGEQPLPYREEEISFENGDVHLEGTLTLPEGDGPFPAAVLITGSGPQNRDEELLGFRVFRVIADHLCRTALSATR